MNSTQHYFRSNRQTKMSPIIVSTLIRIVNRRRRQKKELEERGPQRVYTLFECESSVEIFIYLYFFYLHII